MVRPTTQTWDVYLQSQGAAQTLAKPTKPEVGWAVNAAAAREVPSVTGGLTGREW